MRLFRYLDAYIFVAGDIIVVDGDANIDVAFKKCALFTRCVTNTNGKHNDIAENVDTTMPMYNLIEYSDNYLDTSGRL